MSRRYTDMYRYQESRDMTAWANDAFFYHIYPLGLCGAAPRNDFRSREPPPGPAARLDRPPARLGVDALYLGPVFESTATATTPPTTTASIGAWATTGRWPRWSAALHAAGMRVILDGVFHHVGRDFWAFATAGARRATRPTATGSAGVDFAPAQPARRPVRLRRLGRPLRPGEAEPAQPGGPRAPASARCARGWSGSASTDCGWTWPTTSTRASCASWPPSAGGCARTSGCWAR